MIWAYSLVCLIYGTTFLGIRVGDDAGMPPLLFAAMRFFTAGLLILLVVLLRNPKNLPRRGKTYLELVSVGLLNTTGVFAIVYTAENYVSSGFAALMAATMPFFVVLINWVIRHVRITPVQSLGLGLGFLGVLCIAWPGIAAGIPHWFASTIALVIAQIMASLGTVQSGMVLSKGTPAFTVNGFQLLFGGLGLFVLSMVTGDFAKIGHVHNWLHGTLALVYLTVFGSLLASSLFFVMVKRVGPLFPSTWTYVSPVIAVVAGHLFLGERVYMWTVVGTVAILAGVLIVNYKSLSQALRARTRYIQELEPTVEGSER